MAVRPLQSVETALRVLEAVAQLQPVGVSAVARELGLDKNAAQRALVTLGTEGWIRRAVGDTGTWELTAKSLTVGRSYASGLVERGRPQLEALQAATGETALLLARDDRRMVVVAAVDSAHPLRLTVPLGTSVPLVRVGGFDAFLEPEELAELGDGTGPVPAGRVEQARRNGYYVVDEAYPSAVAVGAPVLDDRRRPMASLLVVAPRSRLTGAERRRVGELVALAARTLSAR